MKSFNYINGGGIYALKMLYILPKVGFYILPLKRLTKRRDKYLIM